MNTVKYFADEGVNINIKNSKGVSNTYKAMVELSTRTDVRPDPVTLVKSKV